MSKNPFLEVDKEILGESGTSSAAADNLYHLCDTIGTRFAGSPGYRQAAEFMLQKFQDYGLTNTELEAFPFTAWRRGTKTEFSLMKPWAQDLDCYALPYSAPTGSRGESARCVDIGSGSEDEVKAAGQRVEGSFVITDGAAGHRTAIYSRCVEAGAAGFVLCSRRPGELLQTGTVGEGEIGSIPAIGISQESGLLIKRLMRDGEVRCRLFSNCRSESSTTWNVIGELSGSEYPEELVLVGGHLDSHDIGPGAFDNGAGVVLVMEAARLLAKQRKHLKRTIRFIGFAAEEIGLLGSHHHAAAHAEELQQARLMINCDTPSLGQPRGLAFHECPEAEAYMERMAEQMETPVVCQNRSHCHSDHYPFILQGMPTAGVAGGRFGADRAGFDHMTADTPDKVSVTDLRAAAAFVARMLLRAASDEHWPDMRRSPEEIERWQAKD